MQKSAVMNDFSSAVPTIISDASPLNSFKAYAVMDTADASLVAYAYSMVTRPLV